jgi:hypothetical protein
MANDPNGPLTPEEIDAAFKQFKIGKEPGLSKESVFKDYAQ